MKTFFGAMMLAVPLLITAGQAYAQTPPVGLCSNGQQQWVPSGTSYCRQRGRQLEVCQNFDLYTCRRGQWSKKKTTQSCNTCSQGKTCVAGIPICVAPDGCNQFNNGQPCDDKDTCTKNDVCVGTKCSGTPVPSSENPACLSDDNGVPFGDVPNQGNPDSLPPCKASPSSPNDIPCK